MTTDEERVLRIAETDQLVGCVVRSMQVREKAYIQ